MKHTGIFAAVVAATLLALAGCRGGDTSDERTTVGNVDLQRFVDRTGGLADAALADTLWRAVREGPPNSVYASFLLGNRYYHAAGDTASRRGWQDPAVAALLDSAEVHFARAVRQDSTFIEGIVNLGTVWDDRSEVTSDRAARTEAMRQAERFYRLALEKDPADEKARCNLGGLYLRQRRTADALAEFQAALEHDPRSALAHYNLGSMFAEAAIYREAIREWELAVKYDPDGDIGDRSRENIRIMKQLMATPAEAPVK